MPPVHNRGYKVARVRAKLIRQNPPRYLDALIQACKNAGIPEESIQVYPEVIVHSVYWPARDKRQEYICFWFDVGITMAANRQTWYILSKPREEGRALFKAKLAWGSKTHHPILTVNREWTTLEYTHVIKTWMDQNNYKEKSMNSIAPNDGTDLLKAIQSAEIAAQLIPLDPEVATHDALDLISQAMTWIIRDVQQTEGTEVANDVEEQMTLAVIGSDPKDPETAAKRRTLLSLIYRIAAISYGKGINDGRNLGGYHARATDPSAVHARKGNVSNE